MSARAADICAATRIVLVRPRYARNLGAVARAMKNFGLTQLVLVHSRIRSWSEARIAAVHAGDVLDGAATTADLATATAPARWIVGTSDHPPPGVDVLTPREVAAAARERGAPTLVFGGEDHGLDPAELLRCHAVSVIPTAAGQTSLNLAQAVCVFAAELFAAGGAVRDGVAGPTPADAAALHRVEAALRELLTNSAWARKSRPKHALARLMQPLYRAQLTADEANAWLVALRRAAQR